MTDFRRSRVNGPAVRIVAWTLCIAIPSVFVGCLLWMPQVVFPGACVMGMVMVMMLGPFLTRDGRWHGFGKP